MPTILRIILFIAIIMCLHHTFSLFVSSSSYNHVRSSAMRPVAVAVARSLRDCRSSARHPVRSRTATCFPRLLRPSASASAPTEREPGTISTFPKAPPIVITVPFRRVQYLLYCSCISLNIYNTVLLRDRVEISLSCLPLGLHSLPIEFSNSHSLTQSITCTVPAATNEEEEPRVALN